MRWMLFYVSDVSDDGDLKFKVKVEVSKKIIKTDELFQFVRCWLSIRRQQYLA